MTTATAEPRPARTPARVTPETELTLLVDVGTAWTKAAVVGRASGRWRVVSGAAQPTAWGETALVEDLVGRLAPHADARLQRRLALLVREAPRITCRSPRRAGRLAVVADHADALESAVALATRSGWRVEAAVAGDDRVDSGERFERLRSAEVDAWLAVPAPGGGSGPIWGLLAAARGEATARVLVVGPIDEPPALAGLFGPRAEWVSERLDGGLADALLAQLVTLNGIAETRTATPLAFGRAVEALAKGLGLAVLGVDLGATWLAWRRSGADERTVMLAGSPDRPMPEGSRAAAEILPTDADEFTTSDSMAGLAARRSGLPATAIEAAIAQAIGVDRLASARHVLGGCPPVDLVVAGGRLLAAVPHPADAALILLDGLRPPGVTQLAIDAWGVCGPLGALADDGDVDEGLETLRDDLLVPLGSVARSEGGQPGQVAFRARLHRPGWPDATPVEVRTGSLAVIPLERGGAGELEITLERGVRIGPATRDPRLRIAVTGGAVGVILDARGDPIQLPARPGDARTMIQTWRDTLRREAAPGQTG
jgi:hypothetical protein